jgi:acyl-CoA thioesterase-1
VNCRSLILVAFTAVAMWLPSPQSADAARRDPANMKTLLVLGDSLSAGFRLERSEAYPALLPQKIRAAGMNYEVLNAGVSGDTTAGGLRRLPNYLRRRIDVLVIQLGINDAFRGVPTEQIRANIQSIIDAARAKNPAIAIVLVGMQIPEFGGDPYVRAFGEMFNELAEKNHTALVPYLLAGVAGDPSLNLPDRIHPNAAGQKILAENVWRVLEPVLQKASAAAAARVE